MNEASRDAILAALDGQERDANLLLGHVRALRELVQSGADVAAIRARLTEAERDLALDTAE